MPDDFLKPLIATDFFICTAPETDALERVAADGKHGLHYSNSEQEIARLNYPIPTQSRPCARNWLSRVNGADC